MAGENLAKRQRLFDLFVGQPGHESLTQGKYFHCPLCRGAYGRDATGGDEPELTLAHIISESQGGTWETLTCKGCNNDNGRAIEADLLASQKITDWIAGHGQIKVRMGKARVVRANLSRGPDGTGFHFDMRTPMQNPAVPELRNQIEDAITKPQGGTGIPFTMSLPRGEWCWAAVCQSAYLLMFHYFGYEFARHETYETLRQQVLTTNKRVWNGNIWVLNEATADEILQGQQAVGGVHPRTHLGDSRRASVCATPGRPSRTGGGPPWPRGSRHREGGDADVHPGCRSVRAGLYGQDGGVLPVEVEPLDHGASLVQTCLSF